jgi:hypothetical protein
LTNKRAAFGFGGWLGKATDPLLPEEIARLSFHRPVRNSSTGRPWFLALRISEQKKQIANFPLASQSVAWRMARNEVWDAVS